MWKRLLMVVAALCVALVGTSTALAAPAAAQRINFPPGGTSYTLTTSLVSGTPQSYLLGISAGQTLYITENGSALVQVFDPHGAVLAGPISQPGPWGVSIPETGDYEVLLAGSGATTVVFYVPPFWQPGPTPWPGYATRLHFAPGTSSTTFGANLVAGMPAGYLLRLAAGQQMYVTLNGGAAASVVDPFGGAVPGTSTGPNQLRFAINWTGDYELVLQGSGPVTVTVYVPPLAPPAPAPVRIRFAPGDAAATVNANPTLAAPSRFILGVAAGQTMYIQVSDENDTVSVRAPNGAAVNTIRTGRPGLWTADAWMTGDYIIAVHGQGPTSVTFYVPPL